MINIDTRAYLLRTFLSLFFFYGILFSLYKVSLKKKLILLLGVLPATFFVTLATDLADVIPVICSYFLINFRKKINPFLLNICFLSSLTCSFVAILVSSWMLPFTDFSKEQSFYFVIVELILEAIILAAIVFLYHFFKIGEFIKNGSSMFSCFLLGYLFLIELFLTFSAHYLRTFDKFISGIVIFLVIQTLVIVFLFIRKIKHQQKEFDYTLQKQQLLDLKKYTDKLENNQQQLRKFKHDYINLLLSLKETALKSGNNQIYQDIASLESYSENYLSNFDWQHSDIENIKNEYLKSLLISKLFIIAGNNLDSHFECKTVIEEIPIPVFDFLRIVGILIDNAIEAAQESVEKKISILIYQDKEQLEFLIENSYPPNDLSVNTLSAQGVSSKQNHEGLGLTNVQEIKSKYLNVFVQYQKMQTKFIAQLIITLKGEV